jgi:hypothetical protein
MAGSTPEANAMLIDVDLFLDYVNWIIGSAPVLERVQEAFDADTPLPPEVERAWREFSQEFLPGERVSQSTQPARSPGSREPAYQGWPSSAVVSRYGSTTDAPPPCQLGHPGQMAARPALRV